MGKWVPRKSTGKRVTKDSKAKGKYPPGVPFYKLPLKAFLRSWPDEDGCMLLTDKQAPTEYFTTSTLTEQLTAESSECIARPGLGISMASASLECCAAALAVLPSSSEKKFGQTGIPAVKKLLEPLGSALAAVNLSNKACSSASSLKQHAEKVLKKLGKKEALQQRVKDFARLADTASRMYAGAMAGLELCALASNPKAWAKKIPNEPKQDKPVRKFMQKKTLDSCVEAVAATNAARLEAKAPRKKRAFGDSSEEAAGKEESGSESEDNSEAKESGSESDHKSGSSSSSHSRGSDEKKKKKKDKKKLKKAEAPKKRATSTRPAAVELSLEDQEEEEEEAKTPGLDPHLSWAEPEVAKFAAELQTMVANQDNKKNRLPLYTLVALLDNVPEAVLTEHGLAKVLQTLKQMTRLPKKEKLIHIFDSMQDMAAKANSIHEQVRLAADAGLPEEGGLPEAPAGVEVVANEPGEE